MGEFVLKWGRWTLNLADRPHIMGVVNVTPDSFSDGGDFYPVANAVAQGLFLAEAGADVLDIGGESTRPGSRPVDADEEIARVIPVIEELVEKIDVPISIDTTKAPVARAALEAGATMINDVAAGRFDPDILTVAAQSHVPLILMHMKGEPRTMQDNPVYDDLIGEIKAFLADARQRAEDAGVAPDMIVLDPGIGFGKTFDHNLILINRFAELAELGCPLLAGPSRKAFLGRILGGASPKERDAATSAIVTLAAYNGAHILRVHDVHRTREALAVTRAVMREHV